MKPAKNRSVQIYPLYFHLYKFTKFKREFKLKQYSFTGKASKPIYRDIKQLESNLNDTLMVAGSEAYVGALSYYNSVKYGARLNVSDAKVIYEDLRKRFERGSYNAPTGETVV